MQPLKHICQNAISHTYRARSHWSEIPIERFKDDPPCVNFLLVVLDAARRQHADFSLHQRPRVCEKARHASLAGLRKSY